MTISQVAAKYLGQTEKSGNMGFNDADFEKKMIGVGFHLHDSWCCYFQELVVKEAIPGKFAVWDKLFSANANLTLANFKAAGYEIATHPVLDSLVVWREMKNGAPVNVGTQEKPIYTGHIGCVSSTNPKDIGLFESIEGNTSTPGVREGYIVAKNPHRVNLGVNNGLQVVGFIIVK